MELKHNKSQGKIVLTSALNPIKLCSFWKIVKIGLKNESYQVIFSRRCLDCLKNKIVYNFPITCSSRINQILPWNKE